MGGIRGVFEDPLLTLIALIALGLLLTVAAALAVPKIPVRAVGEIGRLSWAWRCRPRWSAGCGR